MEISKTMLNVTYRFTVKTILIAKMKINPIFLIHVSYVRPIILWNIFAIIEAMLQVRLQKDVVELLRQVYVAYENRLSEKRGNLLVLETCDTASDTCNEKLHIWISLSKIYKLINVWSDSFNTSLHGRYGIGLACKSYTNAPFSTEFLVSGSCCTAHVMTSEVAAKYENLTLFKNIYSL